MELTVTDSKGNEVKIALPWEEMKEGLMAEMRQEIISSHSDLAQMSAPEREELEDLRKFKSGVKEAFASQENFAQLASNLGYSASGTRQAEVAEDEAAPELTLEQAIAEAFNAKEA